MAAREHVPAILCVCVSVCGGLSPEGKAAGVWR